jgi:hypothetical protein
MALPTQAQKMLDVLSKLAGGKPGEGEFYFRVKPYLNSNLFSLEGIAKLFAGTRVPGRYWTVCVEKHSQGLVLFFSPDNLAATEKALQIAEEAGLSKNTLVFKEREFYGKMMEAGKTIDAGTAVIFNEKSGEECCMAACFKPDQAEAVANAIYRIHREVYGYDEGYDVDARLEKM